MVNGIWAGSQQQVVVAGCEGALLFSRDSGSSWSGSASSLGGTVPATLWRVSGSSTSDVYTVGDRGTIGHSVDGGMTWTMQSSPTAVSLYGVWAGPNDAFVVGDMGTILHSSDHGQTWTVQNSGTTTRLRDVWASGDDVFAVGGSAGFPGEPPASSLIVHSGDGGLHWIARTDVAPLYFVGIWGTGANDVFVGGAGGEIFHSLDRGTTWRASAHGYPFGFSRFGGSASTIFAIAQNAGAGTILLSSDDGSSWSEAVDKTCSLADIASLSDGTALTACADGHILRLSI